MTFPRLLPTCSCVLRRQVSVATEDHSSNLSFKRTLKLLTKERQNTLGRDLQTYNERTPYLPLFIVNFRTVG